MQDALDEMMKFDPSNMDAFNESSATTVDPNVYKTNPKDSKSDDGCYRSKVRVIYNPYSYNQSLVSKTEWYCKSDSGNFSVNAPLDTRDNNRTNPLAQASSKVFLADAEFAEKYALKNFPGDSNAEKRKRLSDEFNAVTGRGKEAWAQKFKGTELGKEILQYAKDTFDNSTSTWALVQILEDANKPELEGRYMIMKVPKVILAKMESKMKPAAESGKKPVDLMSWVLGLPLELEVQPGPDDAAHPERKQREISYDSCDFADTFEPIRRSDNTPLFTDEQVEVLEEFFNARKDADTARSEAKRKEAAAKIAQGTELYNQVRELTKIAFDYLKDEVKVIDLVDKIAYKPWDEATTAKVQSWIDEVTLVNFVPSNNPAPSNPVQAADAGPETPNPTVAPAPTSDTGGIDVPF